MNPAEVVGGQLLTTRELAERWRLSPETVLRWKRRGLIPFVVLPGGSIRYRLEDVERIERERATVRVVGPATLERPGPWPQEVSAPMTERHYSPEGC